MCTHECPACPLFFTSGSNLSLSPYWFTAEKWGLFHFYLQKTRIGFQARDPLERITFTEKNSEAMGCSSWRQAGWNGNRQKTQESGTTVVRRWWCWFHCQYHCNIFIPYLMQEGGLLCFSGPSIELPLGWCPLRPFLLLSLSGMRQKCIHLSPLWELY